MKRNIHHEITQQIITAIENGTDTWRMPWHHTELGRPENARTGARYRGINAISLWTHVADKGYSSNHWASYKQFQQLGAQVRKGERGGPIIFYAAIEDEDDASGENARVILRHSCVFNSMQVDGWIPPAPDVPAADATDTDRLAHVDDFIAATHATILHDYNRASFLGVVWRIPCACVNTRASLRPLAISIE